MKLKPINLFSIGGIYFVMEPIEPNYKELLIEVQTKMNRIINIRCFIGAFIIEGINELNM